MLRKIIDGKKIAAKLKKEIIYDLAKIKKNKPFLPKLVSIIVGQKPETESYCVTQKKICVQLGISFEIIKLSSAISNKKLISIIKKLNLNKTVSGIILNLPLPKHINQYEAQNTILPIKDVESVTAKNLGILFYTEKKLFIVPCTAWAVMECIKESGIQLSGKDVVIVGHSEIVGKSLAMLMLKSRLNSATPTVCHIGTKNLSKHTKRAEILVVAVGKPNFIKASMIKKGAVVIDVGINKLEDKIVGDVDFKNVIKKVKKITPVPGGVGCITPFLLIKNLLNLYKKQCNMFIK